MRKIKIYFNHQEEVWNTCTHAAGIVLGVSAGTVFLVRCVQSGSGWGIFAILLYLFGMLMSYLSSTLYHALSAWSVWKERLRRWDHASIYWHIAGSYAPITLLALRENSGWGWALFAFVCTFALVGSVLSFLHLKPHSHLETVCFIAMGLSALIAFKPLLSAISLSAFCWIIAEGVSYIVGAVFYSFNRRRFMHTVFHFFVLGGTICHLIAVWKILLQYT